jgi:hypothetical protein
VSRPLVGSLVAVLGCKVFTSQKTFILLYQIGSRENYIGILCRSLLKVVVNWKSFGHWFNGKKHIADLEDIYSGKEHQSPQTCACIRQITRWIFLVHSESWWESPATLLHTITVLTLTSLKTKSWQTPWKYECLKTCRYVTTSRISSNKFNHSFSHWNMISDCCEQTLCLIASCSTLIVPLRDRKSYKYQGKRRTRTAQV